MKNAASGCLGELGAWLIIKIGFPLLGLLALVAMGKWLEHSRTPPEVIRQRTQEQGARSLIEERYLYSDVLETEQSGERGKELARQQLDNAARFIATGEYQLGEIKDPRVIARLIRDYSDEYGFSLDDLHDPQVREEVERLLQSGEP